MTRGEALGLLPLAAGALIGITWHIISEAIAAARARRNPPPPGRRRGSTR